MSNSGGTFIFINNNIFGLVNDLLPQPYSVIMTILRTSTLDYLASTEGAKNVELSSIPRLLVTL